MSTVSSNPPFAQNGLTTRPVGTIRIYACGGGGINIGKEYIDDGHTADIAKISTCFLDTSDSNLTDGLADNVYLFEKPQVATEDEVDGSGKVKSVNAELIESKIPEVLRKFPPLDTVIIVTTAGGGTGNVAAFHLHRQLLLQNHPAVVTVMMGSAEAERTAKNTIGSIASLQNIVNETNKPVIFHYGQTKKGVTRSMVDKEAHLIITALCILGSRRIHGLDKADLKMFYNITLPRPDIKPSLLRLRVFDNAQAFNEQVKEPLGAAYLKRDPDDEQPDGFIPYLCEGILPATAKPDRKSLFFSLDSRSLHDLNKEMTELAATLASLETERSEAPVFTTKSEKVSKSGLVYD